MTHDPWSFLHIDPCRPIMCYLALPTWWLFDSCCNGAKKPCILSRYMDIFTSNRSHGLQKYTAKKRVWRKMKPRLYGIKAGTWTWLTLGPWLLDWGDEWKVERTSGRRETCDRWRERIPFFISNGRGSLKHLYEHLRLQVQAHLDVLFHQMLRS